MLRKEKTASCEGRKTEGELFAKRRKGCLSTPCEFLSFRKKSPWSSPSQAALIFSLVPFLLYQDKRNEQPAEKKKARKEELNKH
ncbi:MAG: hypothetical protein ACRC3Z_06365 [Phocaeicola sp.]